MGKGTTRAARHWPPGLSGRTAVVTGGGGAICGAMARAFGRAGVRVAVWDLSEQSAERVAGAIRRAGGEAMAVSCDVVVRSQVQAAAEQTAGRFGPVDILVNGAGGSRAQATTSPDLPFFDITDESLMSTIALNYAGTVIPSQVLGRGFAAAGRGVIVNIASVAGLRPLTRALAYSNAKAAVVSFTQWLAVHMATEYSPAIRVNAIAPGFVLTDQNRFLLVDKRTGRPTQRGRRIMSQVPMGRYGEPDEMTGAALWLASDAAGFVTGAVIPVDGGLSAYTGV